MTEDWRFGLVIGMDTSPELRLLVLGPAPREDGKRWYRETWSALVLADDPSDYYGWPPGQIVTTSPAASGVVTYEHFGSEEGWV